MPTENVESACCANNTPGAETLTLTHDFNDHKTTMTFSKESEVFSLSVENDSSIIKQALEETLIHL